MATRSRSYKNTVTTRSTRLSSLPSVFLTPPSTFLVRKVNTGQNTRCSASARVSRSPPLRTWSFISVDQKHLRRRYFLARLGYRYPSIAKGFSRSSDKITLAPLSYHWGIRIGVVVTTTSSILLFWSLLPVGGVFPFYLPFLF